LVALATIREVQKGEISRLGWLIGVFKHAILADSLYVLCLLLLSIFKILASTPNSAHFIQLLKFVNL
jgi:hypothetical protein